MKVLSKYKNLKLKKYSALLLLLISVILYGCIEEIDLETETFESALVIEATITDKNEQQTIMLSRTFQFEEDGPAAESNAQVIVLDETGTQYNFQESDIAGQYFSTTNFAAQPNQNYQLKITTASGRNYESEAVQLPEGTQIDNLYAEENINQQGIKGAAILLDSYNPEGTSNYYRFEYVETYKIISRFASDQDLIVVSENPPQFDLIPKTQEEEVCYVTVASTSILLANTNSFTEDRLSGYQVRFIERVDPIIAQRYSILVNQNVISREAYTFYETLKSFSESESLFSQIQPGFIEGNITSLTNENEKVIGIFNATAVSSKRIFFNYIDVFDVDDGPPGLFLGDNCGLNSPDPRALVPIIQNNTAKFVRNGTVEGGEGPYTVAPRFCVDCTVFGSNEVPEFWVE
jgi:hypothetical protein|tara:strand:- start:34592 stop:35806 length:1215 start_codon:yes stop_codon:yes gene_type:complete